jgi:cytochrome c
MKTALLVSIGSLAILAWALLPSRVAVAVDTPSVACDSQAGEQIFAICSSCHALAASAPQREGPHLEALFSRGVAAVDGFPYSPALRRAGGQWDRSRLEAFIAKPKRAMPGTTMTFPGLDVPEERAAVICYLESRTQPR